MLITLTSLLAVTINIVPMVASYSNKTSEIIKDFSGNEFILKEGDNSYEILTEDNMFIEGSFSSNSPYYNKVGDKYYLGPGNYFLLNDDVVKDIFSNKQENISFYDGYSYEITPSISLMNSSPSPDFTKTYVDTNGFTVINEADYFRNLTNFPMNWFGECAIISLSMLLSYYDTFYNDDFIPNDLMYDAKYYVEKDAIRNDESDQLVLSEKKKEPLARAVKTIYKDTNYYSFKEWSSMPGTTYAMRDYIFDNYKKTFMNLGDENNGYPMMDGEIKSTLQDYMRDNCPHLLDKTEFRSGNLLFTHQRPKEYISEGLPTLLVLQSYQANIGSGYTHTALCYGYKDDKFLCHFGWNPNTTAYTEVVLNSATIYGYFTIKYNGEHKHSSNVMMTYGNATKYICGCGAVHTSTYPIKPSEWGFDARYYFESEGIKTKTIDIGDLEINSERLRCGYIENQYINLSPNRYNAGYAYLDLSFNKKINHLSTNLTFWSNKEDLKSIGDYAYVKYLDDNGNWVILRDLLKEGLTFSRDNPICFEFDIPNGTTRIKYEAYKANPNTDSNKGRICIGDTTFIA